MGNKVNLREFKDARGSLIENTSEEIFKQTKHFFISKSKSGVIRGNHYHKRKLEWFLVIKGKAKLVSENVKTKERTEMIVSENDNVLIKNPPNHAHAIKNIGGDEMILLALVNEVMDQKDPDTYPYKVL